ncbi:hypothetical protein HDU86_007106 [Geranomyces michiganensis]|nr:hypothetical protein HDU86_007106 [Geranomyces michiganensis]
MATISKANILLCINATDEKLNGELAYIKENFAGEVRSLEGNDPEILKSLTSDNNRAVYLCGDMSGHDMAGLKHHQSVQVIKELSNNVKDSLGQPKAVSIGEIPIDIHGLGFLIREHFPPQSSLGYFEKLLEAHKFQNLTEGNKSGSSFRKGIYLTRVSTSESGDDRSFHLLRCSTNLDGPTENFTTVDEELVHKANITCSNLFNNPAPLNHVLAQVYENSFVGDKDKKARIKAHSDKTKDMPENGLIAFCTFYSKDLYDISKASLGNKFDRVYKDTSVLTQLRFKRKKCVPSQSDLPEKFNIKLYNNSMFVIPLSTNRLYTHKIAPPSLPSDKIPTRLGYVIRCSKTEAFYKNGATYVTMPEPALLAPPTETDRAQLKELYLQENLTDRTPDYGTVLYSLNAGDYLEPTV